MELNSAMENLLLIGKGTYITLDDGSFDEVFVFVGVGFLLLSSSSSSFSGGASGSPIALRRRKTAFSSSDITFGLGGSGASASLDDVEDLSSKSSSASCLLIDDCRGFIGRPNVSLSSSSSESTKEYH